MKTTLFSKKFFSLKRIISFIFCLALIIIVLAVVFGNDNETTSSPSSKIDLYPVIKDDDVFTDPLYCRLRYEEYGYITYEGETLFKEDETGDYTLQDVFCRFFKEYFDSIVAGDVKAYKTFFVSPPKKGDFTTQKLLNIEINQSSQGETEIGGKTQATRNFIVTYNIYQNNGTFRNDLSQSRYDAGGNFRPIAIEEIYTITHIDGAWKIVQIARSKNF